MHGPGATYLHLGPNTLYYVVACLLLGHELGHVSIAIIEDMAVEYKRVCLKVTFHHVKFS